MSDNKTKVIIKTIDRINKSFIKLNEEQFELMKNKKEFNPNVELDCQNSLLLTIGLNILKSFKDLEILKENENRLNGFIKLINNIEEKLYDNISKGENIIIDIGMLQSMTYFLLMIESTLNSKVNESNNETNKLSES